MLILTLYASPVEEQEEVIRRELFVMNSFRVACLSREVAA
jgi:hypothetical protein